jgi:hypothetical protein
VCPKAPEEFAQPATAATVQTREWFVKQENPGFMDDRPSDRQPLPLSARKAPRLLTRLVFQPRRRQQLIGSLGHAIHARHSARK